MGVHTHTHTHILLRKDGRSDLLWMKDIPYQLPHKGTGIEGIYSARQTERERETEAKEKQVVW